MNESAAAHPPQAYRVLDRALVAGVAAGLSAHSQFGVWMIRLSFVLLSFWKFSGAVAYSILWLLLPAREKQVPIGLVAAQRQGLRAKPHVRRWTRVLGWLGSCVIGLGVAYLMPLYDTSIVGTYSVAIVILGIGIGLVWLTRETVWPRWGKALTIVAGILLAWMAGSLLQDRFWALIESAVPPEAQSYFGVVFVSGTAIIGCVIVVLPWIVHPARSEEDTQAELIAETRAEMAAHLHDSVLQTLAVIQKQADDPKAVAQLARRQEKELREWLYQDRSEEESGVTALKEVVAELESGYPVAVDLVTVGDHDMNVEIDAVVRAAREAILNAAKHSGAEKIDVYAEMNRQVAEVYVRDRGCGFDMEDIGEDRMGIRKSIIERMTRFGGEVEVRSTVGEGTEIRLKMPLNEEGAEHGRGV